jgi:acetyl-CoA synthetase
MTSPIVWRPSEEYLSRANLRRLMKKSGIEEYGDLLRRSTRDIRWFWNECLADLGVEWFHPYSRLLDDSDGFPWCRWFTSGQINVVHNCVDRHARNRPGQDAVLWEGDGGEFRRLTYLELEHEIRRVAGALRAEGIGIGDPVGFYMPMVPELVIAFFAVLKIGAQALPVFSAFGPEALAVRLRDARVKLLFTADGCFRRGQAVPIKPQADEALRSVPSIRRSIVVRRTGDKVSWLPERDVWWEQWLAGASEEPATASLDAETRCLIIYTSGTTGRPKGAVHTHGGLIAQTAKELGYNFDLKAGDRFFWLTDIGWMMGPWEILGVTFHAGTVLVYEGAPNWPAPDRLWQIVERHRLTHLGVSPTAIRLLIRDGEDWVRKHDLSSLRILGSTGEPWDPESYQWFFRMAGGRRCPIINISGGTEVMGSLVACTPVAPLKSCSFQGPGLGMDVDVVGEDGNSVRGQVGYLAMRKPAPSMTRGFLNDPQRYLDTYFSRWPGLWYHGDWAAVDEDGYWFIHGRADDTIKVAGRRTGPAEIEAALIRHQAVSEAAAIGVPDDLKGEAVVCFVVLKPEFAVNEELENEMTERITEALGKTLRPRRVHFVKSLPKTRSAKIVRAAIRKRYLGLDPGDVSSIENADALDSIPQAQA